MGSIGLEILFWISVSIEQSHVRDFEFIREREIHHPSRERKACIAEHIIHHRLFVGHFLCYVPSHLIILGRQVFHFSREAILPFLVLTSLLFA